MKNYRILAFFYLVVFLIPGDWVFSNNECDNWQVEHPEWIFCDDFESNEPLVTKGRYFEYGDNNGEFVPKPKVGVGNSKGMEVVWQQGEVGAGGMKLAFGKNPNAYMNKQQICPEREFREIYYRMYLKMEDGWEGNPAKLSRATVFTSSADWRQAMIAHLWSDGKYHLLLDPASCVDENGNVLCTKYNDFANLSWLGLKSGITPIFDNEHDDTWYCIEHHIKLNDPGQKNGIQEFWIDDKLEARKDNLNFTGTYTEYAINAIFFENYWNDGSIKDQKRFFDNIVVSIQRIGCLDTNAVIQPKAFYPCNWVSNGQPFVTFDPKRKIIRLYQYSLQEQKSIQILLYNLKGNVLTKYTTSTKLLNNGYTLNTSSLTHGLYIITIKLRDHTSSISFYYLNR